MTMPPGGGSSRATTSPHLEAAGFAVEDVASYWEGRATLYQARKKSAALRICAGSVIIRIFPCPA